MPKKLDPKVAEKVMLKAGLKPLEPYESTTTKWKCIHKTCGQIVYPVYASVKRGQGGCYECGRRQSERSRRTPESKAVAIMLKAGLQPLEPYTNAVSRWRCKCLKCGYIGYPSLNMINYGQGGCKPCGSVKTGLKSRLPKKEALSRLKKHKLQAIDEYQWHDKLEMFKVKCLICRKNSKTNWDTLQRKGRQPGCRSCSRRAASSLQVTTEKHYQLLKVHNLEPIGKYTGNKDLTSVLCLNCNKKRSIKRSFLLQRKNNMQGCMECAGARIANPLKIARVMQRAKLKPLVPYLGGHKQWECECLRCGEIVYPQFNSILRGQGGCIYCAEIGFNYKKPAIVYLINHIEMNSIKIGVTNLDSKPDRLKQFQNYGWDIHKKYEFAKGIDAFKVEQSVLKWLREDCKLPQHLSIEEMPKTGGQSETVNADLITILEIIEKTEQVIKGYRK